MKLNEAEKIMLYEKQYPNLIPAYKKLLLTSLIAKLPKEKYIGREGKQARWKILGRNEAIAKVRSMLEEAK